MLEDCRQQLVLSNTSFNNRNKLLKPGNNVSRQSHEKPKSITSDIDHVQFKQVKLVEVSLLKSKEKRKIPKPLSKEYSPTQTFKFATGTSSAINKRRDLI